MKGLNFRLGQWNIQSIRASYSCCNQQLWHLIKFKSSFPGQHSKHSLSQILTNYSCYASFSLLSLHPYHFFSSIYWTNRDFAWSIYIHTPPYIVFHNSTVFHSFNMEKPTQIFFIKHLIYYIHTHQTPKFITLYTPLNLDLFFSLQTTVIFIYTKTDMGNLIKTKIFLLLSTFHQYSTLSMTNSSNTNPKYLKSILQFSSIH